MHAKKYIIYRRTRTVELFKRLMQCIYGAIIDATSGHNCCADS